MKPRAYFLVNDTRYDNHHGGLTVVKNLHLGMARRGWTCVGSLPVSSSVRQLKRHRRQINAAQRIIVNGEGSLHHDSRNTGRLFDICSALQQTHPVALINAVWQDNDATLWEPLLARLTAVYARDRRSQNQLQALGIDADYAPDLTFYDYPTFTPPARSGFCCTDSVLKSWTEQVLRLCAQDPEIGFLPLFTGEMRHVRGLRDWNKVIKYSVYPGLWKTFGVPVPPRYRSLPQAIPDTHAFLEKLASFRAVCAARYHALCFVLQQNVPFIAVASNSHKSESLLEEVGLPTGAGFIGQAEIGCVKERLAQAVRDHPAVEEKVAAFNRSAKQRIDGMFDRIAGTP